MLKDFDELIRFCVEHGGGLRNHKQFGEMARELRASIEAVDKSCPECDSEIDFCMMGHYCGKKE